MEPSSASTTPSPSRCSNIRRQVWRLASRPEMWVLVLAALPRLYIAYTDHGMMWPDEIFQSLEPAHKLAFGYGSIPWEFKQGARSWLFPALLAPIMKGAALLGARDGLAIVAAVKTAMVGVGVIGVWAAMRLAKAVAEVRGAQVGRNAALLAGVGAATFVPSLVFGSRAMSEMASATALVVAAWMACAGAGRRRAGWAGAIAAAAIFFRYQNGLVAVGLFFVLLAQRRWREAARYALAGGVVGLLGGALDLLTWGGLFHSFFLYWKVNFIDNGGAIYGIYPGWYYLDVLWGAVGPLFALVALGFLLSARRATGLAVVVVSYVAAHSAIDHKELRFLMPVVPLALALAGVGWAELLAWVWAKHEGAQRTAALVLALGVAGGMFARVSGVTLGELGFREKVAWSRMPPWNFFGGVNLDLAEAGRRGDACGVSIVGIGGCWQGAFSYLHRDIPLFAKGAQWASHAELEAANYLIADPSHPVPFGYQPVALHHGYVLFRRDGPCAPPPPGYRRPME